MKKILAWILLSSKDPSRYSLTAKAGVPLLISILTITAGFSHIHVPGPDAFNQLIDSAINVVQNAVALVTACATAWGLARKLWATIWGENEVINQHPAFQD